jgi:hypothetical protein
MAKIVAMNQQSPVMKIHISPGFDPEVSTDANPANRNILAAL